MAEIYRSSLLTCCGEHAVKHRDIHRVSLLTGQKLVQFCSCIQENSQHLTSPAPAKIPNDMELIKKQFGQRSSSTRTRTRRHFIKTQLCRFSQNKSSRSINVSTSQSEITAAGGVISGSHIKTIITALTLRTTLSTSQDPQRVIRITVIQGTCDWSWWGEVHTVDSHHTDSLICY